MSHQKWIELSSPFILISGISWFHLPKNQTIISFKNNAGALFSPKGTHALTIIDNVIGFWDLQPETGATPGSVRVTLLKCDILSKTLH